MNLKFESLNDEMLIEQLNTNEMSKINGGNPTQDAHNTYVMENGDYFDERDMNGKIISRELTEGWR